MAADKLFEKLSIIINQIEIELKTNGNNFIFAELNSFQVLPIFLDELASILVNKYLNNSQKIATYFLILCQVSKIDTKDFYVFLKKDY